MIIYKLLIQKILNNSVKLLHVNAINTPVNIANYANTDPVYNNLMHSESSRISFFKKIIDSTDINTNSEDYLYLVNWENTLNEAKSYDSAMTVDEFLPFVFYSNEGEPTTTTKEFIENSTLLLGQSRLFQLIANEERDDYIDELINNDLITAYNIQSVIHLITPNDSVRQDINDIKEYITHLENLKINLK